MKTPSPQVVGFVPTGWVAAKVARKSAAAEKQGKGLLPGSLPVQRKGRAEVHLVPYSEHSNFEELKEYVAFLKPRKVTQLLLLRFALFLPGPGRARQRYR